MQSVSSMHGKKRLAIAAGALLAAGGLITAASFTDFANLNIGNGTDDDSGIGGDNKFNIKVVGTDAEGNPDPALEWQEADTAEGVNINVLGATSMMPSDDPKDAVSVEIPFLNASPVLTADISFTLQDRGSVGEAGKEKTTDAAMAAALRYTVELDANGDNTFESTLITAGTQAQVNALEFGKYKAGEKGSMKLTISLPNQSTQEANNALQGKAAYVQAHFDATSVKP